MPRRPLLNEGHDAESMRHMALVLDQVWDQLPEADRNEATREQLARSIVDAFARGEHDPGRLAELARSAVMHPSMGGQKPWNTGPRAWGGARV